MGAPAQRPHKRPFPPEYPNGNQTKKVAYQDRELPTITAPTPNEQFYTALRIGHIEGIELAIQNGANVNLTDDDGSTTLHFCAAKGRTDIAHILVENSASLDIKNKYQMTPLDVARICNQVAMVCFLRAYNLD